MQVTAKAIADILNGTIEGNPDVAVHAPSKIEEGKKGTICFLANSKYEPYAYTTEASVLLVSNDFQPTQAISATLIRVENVYASVAILLKQFGQQKTKIKGISEQSAIDETASIGTGTSIGAFTVVEQDAIIGKNCTIYPQVYIGKGVKIGDNVTLYSGVRVQYNCEIGNDCILHSNVVIGADGFGFAPQEDGSYQKIEQIGNVVIENNVEIGANTTIDRATLGSTIIQSGTKLDNLIMVAHNVEIGKNTVVAAQAGFAGSTKIGDQVLVGGQAGFAGHMNIANGTKIQAQSGVTKSIKKENQAIYGSPAINYSNYIRSYAAFKNLPALVKRIHELEKKLKE